MSKSSTRAWFAALAVIFTIGLPIGFAMSVVHDYLKLQLIFLTLIPLCNSAIYICTSIIGGFALQPRMGGYIWFLGCGVLFLVLAKEDGVRTSYPGLGVLYLCTGLIGIGSLIYDLKACEERVEEGENDLPLSGKRSDVINYPQELEKIETRQADPALVLTENHGGSVWVQAGNDELVVPGGMKKDATDVPAVTIPALPVVITEVGESKKEGEVVELKEHVQGDKDVLVVEGETKNQPEVSTDKVIEPTYGVVEQIAEAVK